jgi:hypothetical protein
MTPSFDAELLNRLAEVEEVEIETCRDAAGPVHRTIIWVVVDDDGRVLIRSVNGAAARWYREATANTACVLWVDGFAHRVMAIPAADSSEIASCSRQLRAKYAADPSMPSMVRPDVLGTTLRLLPR